MNSKHRKYAIPYNGTNPDWFIEETLKRKENIDHVFCEMPLPSLVSHMQFMYQDKNNGSFSKFGERLRYLHNCADFLKKSAGKFKRVCPVNAMYYKFTDIKGLMDFCFEVINTVNKFNVEGIILTDIRIAKVIRQVLPELDIQTSCNGYQWSVRQMQLWKELVGVKLFNPPREILRLPSKLKEMHDAGFKLKCLVNESCLVGCINSFNHQMSISLGCLGTCSRCYQKDFGDLLRSNWILPRWQKFYDKYVEVYKIAGRNTDSDYPFRCMDAYLFENNSMRLCDLIISGTHIPFNLYVSEELKNKLTLDKIPDKLAFCECKNCKSCTLCEKFMNEYCESSLHSKFFSDVIVNV